MSYLVKKAMLFAMEKHKGQKYGDKDYFLYHICSVVDSLRHSITADYCYGEGKNVILAAAYLHDVVEDTDTTIEDIEKEFGVVVPSYVQLLTKQKGEDREDYLKRLCVSPVAALIKLHDATMNATQCFCDGDLKRAVKYLGYIEVLGKQLSKLSNKEK